MTDQGSPTYEELKARLHEAEATLESLRRGEVDVVMGPQEPLLVRFKSLVEERERLSRLVTTMAEMAPTLIVVTDPKGQIVRFNRACQDLTGHTEEEVLGKTVADLFGPGGPVSFCDPSGQGFDKPITRTWTTKKGEKRRIEWRCAAIASPDGDGHFVLAIGLDVTEARELEAQRTQLLKAEGLNRMAGAIAHHFNNHLQAVMGYLQLAMDELPPDGSVSGALMESMKAAQRAAGVSRQMLTYLGKGPGGRETMDLSEICRGSLADLKKDFPQNVVLEVDLISSGPPVHVNRNQMGQVVGNLVANACEAMADSGGVIGVGVRTVPSEEKIPLSTRFPVGWEPQGRAYACLEVRDTGPGIPDEDLGKLFDPFFSTKFTGRGLGLPVVLGIVHAHGGCIVVESRVGPGVGGRGAEVGGQRTGNREVGSPNAEPETLNGEPTGSVFRVYLPLSAEAVPRRKKNAISATSGGGTVLLVEDATDLRRLGRLMLQKLGFEVLTAEDGVEGVRVFREHRDEIRFVLCDLTMPRMDGWEVLAAIREMRPDIPVILASGYDEASVMTGDHPEWPQAFLPKPYRLDDLRKTISRMIGP